MNAIHFPPTLSAGQTIGIFAPSSAITPEKFESGVAILKERGYNLVIHPQTYQGSATGNQYAGPPEQKAQAFMDLWENPDVHAIMAACGGNMAAHILPLLNWNKIAETPKLLMGFSDTTALLAALHAKSSIAGFFGPTVQTLARVDDLNLVFRLLEGKQSDLIPLLPAKTIRHGLVSAPVFAATLSVLNSLIGTSFFPLLQGHILVLEDVGEELSRLDRALWQLDQAIDFSALTGMIFGDFVDVKDTGRPFGHDLHDIITSATQQVKGPVVVGAPIGHGGRLFPIPNGRKVTLDTLNTPHLILE